jgi:Prokaryotic Cytochrome C oxidase subunit IV
MDFYFSAALFGGTQLTQGSAKPTLIWAGLMSLTLISVALFESGWLGRMSSVLIVLIAAFKSRLVILHYMEATHAARHWRFLYETWNFAVTATITIGYLLSLRQP